MPDLGGTLIVLGGDPVRLDLAQRRRLIRIVSPGPCMGVPGGLAQEPRHGGDLPVLAGIRYLILANAGGILACLGIAGALVNGKGAAGVVSFSTIVVPMGLFLLGLVAGGVIVSLLHKRASYAADQRAREALRILREAGQIVPAPAASFSPLELKSLPHLATAINVLGLISQFSFVIGAVWGMVGVAIHR